ITMPAQPTLPPLTSSGVAALRHRAGLLSVAQRRKGSWGQGDGVSLKFFQGPRFRRRQTDLASGDHNLWRSDMPPHYMYPPIRNNLRGTQGDAYSRHFLQDAL